MQKRVLLWVRFALLPLRSYISFFRGFSKLLRLDFSKLKIYY